MAARAGGDQALTTADVVRFLRAGISERTILLEVQSRGFGESSTGARDGAPRGGGERDADRGPAARRAGEKPPVAASDRPAAPERDVDSDRRGALVEHFRGRHPRRARARLRPRQERPARDRAARARTSASWTTASRRRSRSSAASGAPAHRAGAGHEPQHAEQDPCRWNERSRYFIDILEPADQILVIDLQRPRPRRPGLHVRPGSR